MTMENNEKIILDLCGGTGAWSRPYREAGYDVRLITLPEHNVLTYEPPTGVYGILAAPPCTEFSLAKGGQHRDFQGGMNVISACLRIIWECRISGSLKFWALENPLGFLRQFIGRPHFTFEQWWYGGDKCKATDLWGYFQEPAPTVKQMPKKMQSVKPEDRRHARDWSRRVYPPEYENYLSQFQGDAKRAAIRAITPSGFAQAFFKANR